MNKKILAYSTFFVLQIMAFVGEIVGKELAAVGVAAAEGLDAFYGLYVSAF